MAETERYCFVTYTAVGMQMIINVQSLTVSGQVLAWLCVWVKVQICMWSSWCHCHSLSLALVNVFTFLVLAHLVVCVGRKNYHLGTSVISRHICESLTDQSGHG